MTDDDAELMARFVQTRDRRLFAKLFERYERRMFNHTRRFVRDAARAEELVQDVFIRMYTTKRYEPQTKFSTWLYRVATNVCLNELRRPEHQQQLASLDAASADERPTELPSPAADPEATAHGQQLAQRLSAAMDRLPPKQRAAFMMARQDHMSHEEIAAAMQTSVSAVKSLIHRALEALRREALAVMNESPGLAQEAS
ncbi:MAG: sigma-70 family RNA polymerase sigma factor [Myxococcota bacterium]